MQHRPALQRIGIRLATACLFLSAAASTCAQSIGDRLAGAAEAYESCHWARAFQQFQLLADEGSPAAARIALDMVRFGPQLFGQAFQASSEQRARWRDTVDRQRASPAPPAN